MDFVEIKRDCYFPGELLCILREKNTPETPVYHKPKEVNTRSWEFSCNSCIKGKEADSLAQKVKE